MNLISFSTYTSLTKTKLSLMLTASAFVGHILAAHGKFSINTLLICFAVFMLAAGAAVINNIQDRNIDRHMERTCRRPIARGFISIPMAVLIAGIHLIISTLLFWQLSSYSLLPAALGVLAILLYNGIYTPLKPKSMWAIVPGSLCGAIPPLIGWYATETNALPTHQIILLTLIIWMWQFPHFWLKMLSFSKDYRENDTLLARFPKKHIDMFITVWTGAFTILILSAPLYGLVFSTTALSLVILLAIILSGITWFCLFKNFDHQRYQQMFTALNFALFLFMLISASDHIAASNKYSVSKSTTFLPSISKLSTIDSKWTMS